MVEGGGAKTTRISLSITDQGNPSPTDEVGGGRETLWVVVVVAAAAAAGSGGGGCTLVLLLIAAVAASGGADIVVLGVTAGSGRVAEMLVLCLPVVVEMLLLL